MRWARSDRGVILILVAVSIFVLTAMSAFVLDYGVVWVSRSQAQNAADAGALAGAIARLHDDLDDPPLNGGLAYQSAFTAASMNQVLGEAPGVAVSWVCPTWPSIPVGTRCVRVDTFRDGDVTNGSTPLPAYFANLFGITSQRVRATATAKIGAGSRVRCMLPFAVIDRWADFYDDEVVTTGPGGFLGDGGVGTEGWSPNDDYQPGSGDVYTGPYGGNTDHTGWRVTTDYGRQLILKDGSPGSYSSGWANVVQLPGDIGFAMVPENISGCNEAPVGIATESNPCLVVNEPNGCINIQTGVGVGPVATGINDLVGQDGSAAWVSNADGGAVVGGGGMDSPRIRPIAIVDINHYELSGCSGSTCVAKLANIIGFFVEGMCNDVDAAGGIDAGMACDPNPAEAGKEVVGRIVTLPAKYILGGGDLEESAAFLKYITLIQ